MCLKMLSDMEHDGEPVKSNQFLFKAVLINFMLALNSNQMTEQDAMRLQSNLSGIY